MLAELLVRYGHTLIRNYPPDGRRYWSERFWDRDWVESRPILGNDLRAQKAKIADLIDLYARNANRIVEFACGTGEFTLIAATQTTAREIVATDISRYALDVAKTRVADDRVCFIQHDFWSDESDLGRADLVLCVDAIHHLGDVRSVLQRLRSYVAPGGVLIGNIWSLDNFHECQRQIHGSLGHFVRAAQFFVTALAMRISRGHIRTASYRTQLLRSDELDSRLTETFSNRLAIHSTRHFVCFACQP